MLKVLLRLVTFGLIAGCLGPLGGCSSDQGGAQLGNAPVDPKVEAANSRSDRPAPPKAP
jgi:hypothetical protein